MGAFYNSICVPGDHRESVRRALVRWLAAKGFEPCPGPVLFDLDGDYERSVFLVSSERWTVLFYSHYEEERRLIRELQAEHAPILYLWVYDSDVWGWDLFDGDGFVASFNPDPRTHQSFAEETVGSPQRPRGDAETLCRALGLGVEPAALRRIERLRAPFKEDVCRRFCHALGVEVAASSYDDLESGALRRVEGWRSEQLLFSHRLAAHSREIDLHRHGLQRLQPEMAYAPSETLELPPEILAEMQRMRRRVRLAHRLLRPVSWLARTWRGLREAASRRRPAASLPEPPPLEAPANFRVESAVLINDRHRCRITLAEGVRPTVVSKKPASVFAFAVGASTVTCTARRPAMIDEVLRKPSRAKVLHDEAYLVGALKARHLLFELPPSFVAGSQEPSYLAIYVVQTALALYVFLHRSRRPLAERERAAVRATVDSFRLLSAPARRDDADG